MQRIINFNIDCQKMVLLSTENKRKLQGKVPIVIENFCNVKCMIKKNERQKERHIRNTLPQDNAI